MSDRLYLSLWLKRVSFQNPLAAFEKLVNVFPVSKLGKASSTLYILAVDFSEPPVAEIEIPPGTAAQEIAAMASEFHNPDSCFQLDTWWDLWNLSGDWRLAPARVSIASFAEKFDRPDGEDLRIEFGLESQFLPLAGDGAAARIIQSNIRSLLRLVHEIEKTLPVEKKLLWSESGENFADRLQKALTEAVAEPLN